MTRFFPHLVYDRDDGYVFAWGGPGHIVLIFKYRTSFERYMDDGHSWDYQEREPFLDGDTAWNEVRQAFVDLAREWQPPTEPETVQERADEPDESEASVADLIDRLRDKDRNKPQPKRVRKVVPVPDM